MLIEDLKGITIFSSVKLRVGADFDDNQSEEDIDEMTE